MLVAFCAALAAAIVVITWARTSVEYKTLPDRVPLNLGFGGAVNSYGPRGAIWLLPAAQLLSAAIFSFAGYALAVGAPGAHGSLRGLAFFAPCILSVLWRAQSLIISAAQSGASRVPMGGFWLFFVAMLGAGTLAMFFL